MPPHKMTEAIAANAITEIHVIVTNFRFIENAEDGAPAGVPSTRSPASA